MKRYAESGGEIGSSNRRNQDFILHLAQQLNKNPNGIGNMYFYGCRLGATSHISACMADTTRTNCQELVDNSFAYAMSALFIHYDLRNVESYMNVNPTAIHRTVDRQWITMGWNLQATSPNHNPIEWAVVGYGYVIPKNIKLEIQKTAVPIKIVSQ